MFTYATLPHYLSDVRCTLVEYDENSYMTVQSDKIKAYLKASYVAFFVEDQRAAPAATHNHPLSFAGSCASCFSSFLDVDGELCY
jgi:hypothetical protein